MTRLFARSVLAGVLIALGALFSIAAAPYGNVVQGVCFSVGLFGVLTLGASLFTGRMMEARVLGPGDVPGAAASWARTWVGNLAGALAVALLAHAYGIDAGAVAAAKAGAPSWAIVARAVLCNVCVCGAVACYQLSTHGALNALACAVPFVACFVACGFEHCVADMCYMPLGLLSGAVGWLDCACVLALATVGNVVGGVAFALLIGECR